MDFEMRALFQEAFKLLSERSPTSRPRRGDPVFDFFKKFQILLQNLPFSFGFEDYVAEASVGKGGWAAVPWIGFRSERDTTNFQTGLFVVYLLSPDFERFYLAIIQGVKDRNLAELTKGAKVIRKEIEKPEGFVDGIEGALTRSFSVGSLPYLYEKAVVFSKKYYLDQIPEESKLRNDLKNVLTAHQSSRSGVS